MGADMRRREFITLISGAAAWPLLSYELVASEEELADPKKLKPGEFAWHPERSPEGPVVIIVSIPDQWVAVYRNGTRIAVSTCSTGRPGHATPTGTFVILQKDVDHHSSIYNNAAMPYMERVTWGGVALHAGNLPGYPASHGCVRLPKEFSHLLFGVTHVGTAVIIADRNSEPADVLHPGLLISDHAEELAKAAVAKAKENSTPIPTGTTSTERAVCIVLYTTDKRIRVLVNGEPAFEDDITVRQPDLPFGTHVFALTGQSDNPTDLKWMAVDLNKDINLQGKPVDPAQESALLLGAIIRRVDVPSATAHRLSGLLHAGATMVITDERSDDAARTGPGFTIMTQDDT